MPAAELILIDLTHMGGAQWGVVWRDSDDRYYASDIEAVPCWDRDDQGRVFVERVEVETSVVAVYDNDDELVDQLGAPSLRLDQRLVELLQQPLKEAAEAAAEDFDPYDDTERT